MKQEYFDEIAEQLLLPQKITRDIAYARLDNILATGECAEVLNREFRQEVQYGEYIEAWSTYQDEVFHNV